jgi:hypothetical protein
MLYDFVAFDVPLYHASFAVCFAAMGHGRHRLAGFSRSEIETETIY